MKFTPTPNLSAILLCVTVYGAVVFTQSVLKKRLQPINLNLDRSTPSFDVSINAICCKHNIGPHTLDTQFSRPAPSHIFVEEEDPVPHMRDYMYRLLNITYLPPCSVAGFPLLLHALTAGGPSTPLRNLHNCT